MLRISTTTIERFRSYIDEDKFFGNILVTEEKLLDSIKGDFTGTPKTEMGTAFHECLEKPNECYDRYLKQGGIENIGFMSSKGFVFDYKEIKYVFDLIDYDFPFEVKKTKIYEIDGEQIEVVGQVDQWQGNIVNEHKTCWGEIYFKKDEDGNTEKTTGESFDWEKYYKSCQWKFYLEIFDAQIVRYKVFELAIDKTDGDQIKLIDKHPFDLFPYDGMHDDIIELLTQFVNYIHFRKLEGYFQPKRENKNEIE